MRKICVVTTNRADYGRLKPLMEEIKKNPKLELQIVVGSHLYFDSLFSYLKHGEPFSFIRSIPWYLKARLATLLRGKKAILQFELSSRILTQDGFRVDAHLPLILEGGNLSTMVKSAGLGLLGLPKIFKKLKPDIVLINGDRFEIFSVATATVFLNIHLAHIEGGDVSGTIDNSIRHAISKLAHIHFPATKKSAERLIRMGEHPNAVLSFGSPIIDSLKDIDTNLDNSFYERYPEDVGRIDLTKLFILVAHHPVTTEYKDNYRQTKELIEALKDINMPSFFVSSNIDGGSDGVSVAIREFRESNPKNAVFHKTVSIDEFVKLLANASVVVGNSSALIREAAYLGTPAVVVGNRQKNRERGENVIEVPALKDEIISAIRKQIKHGRYESDMRFGDGTASKSIVDTLASLDLEKINVQKYFFEG